MKQDIKYLLFAALGGFVLGEIVGWMIIAIRT